MRFMTFDYEIAPDEDIIQHALWIAFPQMRELEGKAAWLSDDIKKKYFE